jgi:hypothetical protein
MRAGGCAEHAGKRAELREQRFGERLGVLARDGAVEEKFEEFVVGERARTGFIEACAQARAVIVVVGLVFLDRRHLAGMPAGRSDVQAVDFKREGLGVFDAR